MLSTTPGLCIGDCDHNGSVTIDEILKGVGMAVGTIPIGDCPEVDANADQVVTVDELLRAVAAALNGCQTAADAVSVIDAATNTLVASAERSIASVIDTGTNAVVDAVAVSPGPRAFAFGTFIGPAPAAPP